MARSRTGILLLTLTLAALLVGLLAVPAGASAATYVVNMENNFAPDSPCNSGPFEECTLYEAIERANEDGEASTITFDPELETVFADGELPSIQQPLTIDGAVGGAPGVEITGATEGRYFRAFEIRSSEVTIEGLSLVFFNEPILVEEGRGATICGNYIGVETDGETAEPNRVGIEIEEDAEETSIGANCAAGGNVISGNEWVGIYDRGFGTLISNNKIGVSASGAALPNGGFPEPDVPAGGIIAEGEETTIGRPGEGNTIADNQTGTPPEREFGGGVIVNSTSVRIEGNSIFDNVGSGIDYFPNPGPPVPVLESAASTEGGSTVVKGKVTGSVPDENLTVDLYANTTCDSYEIGGDEFAEGGEGERYLGEETNVTDAQGNLEFEVTVPAQDAGTVLTATATAGATSEFSQCLTAPQLSRVLEVDTLEDTSGGTCTQASNDCSLRDALEIADSTSVIDTIQFAQGGVIEVASPLPLITAPVEIDATTLPGFADAPLVGLQGTGTAAEHEGLALIGGSEGSSIRGLEVGGFEIGIYLASGENEVCADYLGLDLNGETALPNRVGVQTGVESPENMIGADCPTDYDNLISGNTAYGVVDFGSHTQIAGNLIGLAQGGEELGNGRPNSIGAGVLVTNEASRPLIGGGDEIELPANTIAFNEGAGIKVENSASDVSVRRNSIYADSEGALVFGDGNGTASTFVEAFTEFGGETTWFGPLKGAEPETEYDIDLFASARCDASGYGPGQSYLGSETVTTDSSGEARFEIDAGSLEGIDAEVFTATATSTETGRTSQFSECARTSPKAEILSTPAALSNTRSPTFTFSGTDFGHVNHYLCTIDEEPAVTCSSPYEPTGLSDGPHTFRVTAVDDEGFFSEPATYEWTVDATPPTVTIQGVSPEVLGAGGSSEVSFTASEEGGFEVRLGGDGCDSGTVVESGSYEDSPAPAKVTIASSELVEGSNTVRVCVTDAAGNLESATSTIVKDTTPPAVSLENRPPALTSSPAAEFTFTGSDTGGSGIAGYKCSLDGADFTTCTSPATYTGLSDGSHEFAVESLDEAGNASAAAQWEWTVDTTPPAVSLENRPPALTSSPAAEFTFTGSDTGGSGIAGYKCSLDGADFTTCTSPATYTGLSDGSHEFAVESLDEAGNASAAAEWEWTVDTTPPQTSIEVGPPAETEAGKATFTFSGSDSESGVASYECSLDGGAYEPCTSPYEVEGLKPGAHTMSVRSVDAAGNTAAPTTYEWTVASKPPPAEEPKQPNTQPLVETKPIPVNGERVAVAPKEGVVYITRPNGKKKKLQEGQTIPVGSVIDATHGKVTLTSINANGEEQTANFFGGVFVVIQHDGSGLVILKLRGGDFSSCPQGGAGTSARKGRRLWGSGHGNFRTEGNYGSATVRGTIWFTEDRCDGTFFKTKRGIVEIRDFTTHKTLSLPKGHRYLAKP